MKLLQQEALSRIGDINGSFTPGKENVPQQEILSKLGEANVIWRFSFAEFQLCHDDCFIKVYPMLAVC
jgi:hypothetical protein